MNCVDLSYFYSTKLLKLFKIIYKILHTIKLNLNMNFVDLSYFYFDRSRVTGLSSV